MTPHPVSINLRQKSRVLVITFDDGSEFELSCELLRVCSPSADVRGHGPGQEVLQVGKENVNIREIEPIGNYAVRLVFDDGHSTGLYAWDYLYDLGRNRDGYWRKYLAALKAAGYERNTGKMNGSG
ncbi:MAG: DUF971 domain-containing protein [Gammaproteobacteria bacterium]|nr:DUF971 domain-containing protein [Gammaproteobacteria bacterium]